MIKKISSSLKGNYLSIKIRILIYTFLLVLFSCCPFGVRVIDKGSLEDESLLMVPYQENKVVFLKNHLGDTIEFNISRQFSEETDHCADCCDQIVFEENTTILKNSNSKIEFVIAINNRSSDPFVSLSIGNISFYIPEIDKRTQYQKLLDTMIINNVIYKNVFILKSNYTTLNQDTLLYNYINGIISVKLDDDFIYSLVDI